MRLLARVTAVVTVAALAAACAGDDGQPVRDTTDDVTRTAADLPAEEDTADAPLSEAEDAYLSDLDVHGVLVDRAEQSTMVEIGHGICRSLDAGTPPEEFDDRLSSVAASLAARSGHEVGPDDVTHALVETSREHLCS